MCGVDILPSELPREASAHFGDKLLAGGFAASLAHLDPAVEWSEAQATLPVELGAACIAADGELTERWKYIEEMRSANKRNTAAVAGASNTLGAEEVEGSTVVELSGHLFDSGLLNGVLDLIEQHGAMFAIVDMNVRPNAAEAACASTAHLQISASGGRAGLEEMLSAVEELVKSTSEADATVLERKDYCGGDYGLTLNDAPATSTNLKPVPARQTSSANSSEGEGETVLVLGAGLVARPAVELLSRRGGRKVVLISGVDGEAAALADKLGRSNVVPITMDCSDISALRPHVASSSSILSLLPATMHQDVALAAIDSGVPLVTASYVSDELRSLQSRAAAAGVPVLGEMGLDPGMDHMSAMEMIDAAAAAGATVRSFRSVCGGLPAPEAANNMLRYKFSWSPRGVLSAASNDAQWLENGQVISVRGSQLLAHSSPTNAVPTLNLEVLPNRNSLPYKEAYRLHDAETVYRGTLRFAGFCDRVLGLQQMGLLNGEALKQPMVRSAN
jgi:alpha-aminoadipic semialdehyde synthase